MSARLDLFATSDPRDGARSTVTGPLYTTGQVVVGSVLGTPMAGAAMLAMNARQLGNSALRPLAFGAGLLACILAVVPMAGLAVGFLLGLAAMTLYAYTYQHDDITLALRQGAPRAGPWEIVPVLVGGILASAVLSVLLVVLLVLAIFVAT